MGDVVTANRNDSGLNYDAAAAASVAADGGQSAVGEGGRGADGGIAGKENSSVKDHETAMVSFYGTDIGLVGRPGGDVPLLQVRREALYIEFSSNFDVHTVNSIPFSRGFHFETGGPGSGSVYSAGAKKRRRLEGKTRTFR